MAFRFVHTADIHLDSPLRSLSLRNPELAALIGDATRAALSAIVDLCLEERVDALVIAGDLYDGDQTSMKTARFLGAEMARLHEAGIAVYKIRGNHDAMSRITKQLVLPPSLRVFGDKPDMVRLSKGAVDVAIHGVSFAKPQAPESLLPRFSAPAPDAVNIGILHTSLGGAAGHDVYAPCSLADLAATGFRYWALGHIHQRAEHAGPATIVMPGNPQGRDINEAGAKTVSLVTVRDGGEIRVEERVTSLAEFRRVTIDLSGFASWREAVEAVGGALLSAHEATRSPHLVARVTLKGQTPLAFRLRRDADLLLAEAETRAARIGPVWIEAIRVETAAPGEAAGFSQGPGGDPVAELGALIREGIATREDLRAEVRGLVTDLMNDLPPDIRAFSGEDEEGFERFVDRLMREGGEDMLARLVAGTEAETA